MTGILYINEERDVSLREHEIGMADINSITFWRKSSLDAVQHSMALYIRRSLMHNRAFGRRTTLFTFSRHSFSHVCFAST